MKALFQNRPLCLAVVVSVLIHAFVLSARFSRPTRFDLKIPVSSIELVLTNEQPGKTVAIISTEEIEKAENRRTGRRGMEAASPEKKDALPVTAPSKKPQIKSTKTSPPVNTASAAQKKILSKSAVTGDWSVNDSADSRSVVFRRQGNGQGSGNGGTEGFSRTIITAGTQDVGYALYYKALRKKVENLGLINFPQKNGARLYGELTVRIPVWHDGTLYEKEGGPEIDRSSGNPALDKAALNIIRRAAPFGPFPKSMRSKNGNADVWVIVTRLKFTRDQGVQSQVRSTLH